jgi:hypothetical protein
MRAAFVAFALLATAAVASAQTPDAILKGYAETARRELPDFAGFSPQRGKELFQATHGGEWSCASCHTTNPAAVGKHARTGKSIAPLAPAVNSERFTSVATADKWFKRNCNDVIGRACTAQQKGDVLAYLMQIKP